jgi:hypothetical protein
MDWDAHAEREEARYEDGLGRLPDEADARQKQLVRMAMAAGGAGLARLMQGRRAEAVGWLTRSAERYRESYADAPPESWGRPIGALKARLIAGDRASAAEDARWTLELGARTASSPIGRYAACLAALVLEQDEEAAQLAEGLEAEPEESFPRAVAGALAALAHRHAEAYAPALATVLASFEAREEYLESVPVADTVLVLETLAAVRGIAARPTSLLLPPEPAQP